MAITPNRTLPNDWSSETTYYKGDEVVYLNIIYSAQQTNVNQIPWNNTEYWKPLDIYIKDSSVMEHGDYSGDANFWERDHLYIDGAGWVYVNNENTGINVTGPASTQVIDFEDLTPAQREQIKGAKGDVGPQGPQGPAGPQGPVGEVTLTDEQIEVLKGEEGKSAYEVWLENGHTGTETDFLNWLQSGIITLDTSLDASSTNGVQNKVITQAFEAYQRRTNELIRQLTNRIIDLENRLKYEYRGETHEFKFGVNDVGNYGYMPTNTDIIIPFSDTNEVVSTSFTMRNGWIDASDIAQSASETIYETIDPTNFQLSMTSFNNSVSNNTGEDISVMNITDFIADTAENGLEPTYYGYKNGNSNFHYNVEYGYYNLAENATSLDSLPIDPETPEGTKKGTGVWFSSTQPASRAFIKVEANITSSTSPYDTVVLYTCNNLTSEQTLPDAIDNQTYSVTVIHPGETVTIKVPLNRGYGACIGTKNTTGNFKITEIYLK